MKINKQLTLSQILGAVAKHKVKSMFTFLLVTSLVVLLFLSWPRYYGSEGRIFVRVTNPASSDPGIADSDGSVTHTRSVEQLIKSRGVMESVVDEIGAEPILANSFFQWLKPKFNFFGTGWNQDSEGFTADEYRNLINRELAASKLENKLSVNLTENSNVISVYCLAPSSQLAQKVVDIAMKKTQEKHREINQSNDVQKLAEELRQDEVALTAAEKRLSDFRIQNDILSVDRAEARLASTLQLLEQEVVGAQAELDQATELQRSLSKDAESDEEVLASTELKLEIVKATASMNASRARLDSLKKQQDKSQLQLRELNDKRRVGTNFQRKLAAAQEAVVITTARINEAKSISSTEIKDVVIAQPANFLVKHVSPRGSIVLPSGLVLAGMVATATALYFERDLLSGSLRDEEVEQILEIPVLVSLPRVASQKNMVG